MRCFYKIPFSGRTSTSRNDHQRGHLKWLSLNSLRGLRPRCQSWPPLNWHSIYTPVSITLLALVGTTHWGQKAEMSQSTQTSGPSEHTTELSTPRSQLSAMQPKIRVRLVSLHIPKHQLLLTASSRASRWTEPLPRLTSRRPPPWALHHSELGRG